MTTYRLFPSTSGPSSGQSYSGNFISAVAFTVSEGGCFFDGYWWWVAGSVQSTSPVKCALWSVTTNSPAGVLVPGSVVTSGTLTAGQWNYIPLSAPVPLAPGLDPTTSTDGSAYVAAIGCNGDFPDTNGFWGTGGPGVNGITNGPLFAYSGVAAHGGTVPGPLGLQQGLFTVGESDPSSGLPGNGSNVDNFWVDVQIDTAPSGYTGTYRLWPNKYDANSSTTTDSLVNYTIATEIDLSVSCTLNNAWYYSPPGARQLATRADVWDISTGLSVASITSPTWLTPSGSAGAAAGGWLKAAFAANTTIPAGNYRVSVYCANGTSGAWGARDAGTNYWGNGGTGGVGAAGITAGPLTAPAQPAAASGWLYDSSAGSATPPYSSGTAINAQPVFGQLPAGTVDFPQLYAPNTGTTTQNYWVDLEVTPPASVAGTATMAGAGSLATAATQAAPATMQGAGALSDTATEQPPATIQGQGAVGTAATEAAPATIQGNGQLADSSADGSSTSITGQGTLAPGAVQDAGTTMQGGGQLGAPDVIEQAGTTFAGQGSIDATGSIPGGGDATITGQGTLSAPDVQETAAAVLAGQGQLSGTGTSQASGNAATMQGGAQLGAPDVIAPAATMAGHGSITAAATVPGSLPPLPDGITAGPPYGRWSAGQPHG